MHKNPPIANATIFPNLAPELAMPISLERSFIGAQYAQKLEQDGQNAPCENLYVS